MEDKNLHFVGKVAQKAIIEHGGKVLVCRGVGDTVCEFPGGRLHKGEEPRDGLKREVFEELNINIKVGRPIFTCRSWHSKSNTHNFFIAYICSVENTFELQQNDEVVEVRWVSPQELKVLPMFDDCKEAASTYLSLV